MLQFAPVIITVHDYPTFLKGEMLLFRHQRHKQILEHLTLGVSFGRPHHLSGFFSLIFLVVANQ